MKTAISVPNPLFNHAEKLSKRLHMSRSQLYATALAEFLSKHRDDLTTEQLNVVYDAAPAGLDPILRDAQSRLFKSDPW